MVAYENMMGKATVILLEDRGIFFRQSTVFRNFDDRHYVCSCIFVSIYLCIYFFNLFIGLCVYSIIESICN